MGRQAFIWGSYFSFGWLRRWGTIGSWSSQEMVNSGTIPDLSGCVMLCFMFHPQFQKHGYEMLWCFKWIVGWSKLVMLLVWQSLQIRFTRQFLTWGTTWQIAWNQRFAGLPHLLLQSSTLASCPKPPYLARADVFCDLKCVYGMPLDVTPWNIEGTSCQDKHSSKVSYRFQGCQTFHWQERQAQEVPDPSICLVIMSEFA